jgi:hypothetical protein
VSQAPRALRALLELLASPVPRVVLGLRVLLDRSGLKDHRVSQAPRARPVRRGLQESLAQRVRRDHPESRAPLVLPVRRDHLELRAQLVPPALRGPPGLQASPDLQDRRDLLV